MKEAAQIHNYELPRSFVKLWSLDDVDFGQLFKPIFCLISPHPGQYFNSFNFNGVQFMALCVQGVERMLGSVMVCNEPVMSWPGASRDHLSGHSGDTRGSY